MNQRELTQRASGCMVILIKTKYERTLTFLCDNVLDFFRFPFQSSFLVQTTKTERTSKKFTSNAYKKDVKITAQSQCKTCPVAQCECIIFLPFNLIHFFFLRDINGIANSLRLLTSSFQSFHFLKKKAKMKKREKQKSVLVFYAVKIIVSNLKF